MYLLDTNVLSELVRPRPDARVVNRLLTLRASDLFASAVTRYELRYGACLRKDTARFWARLQADILPLVTWLPVTQEIAETGGKIAADLRLQGRSAGDLDPLIGATATAHDLVLVTRNTRHFECMTGLRLENWFVEN